MINQKSMFYKVFILIIMFSSIQMQVVPYKEPLSKFFNIDKINLYKIDDIINKSIPFTCLPSNNNNICQIKIEIPYRELYSIELSIEGSLNNDNLFILLNENNFLGPYQLSDNTVLSQPIHAQEIIIELNTSLINPDIYLTIDNINFMNLELITEDRPINVYEKNDSRENPIILLTGYWPPTNEMIRHFSQNNELNLDGWQGENWENRGYDIVSYFPEFTDPDCNSCGQGYGDLEVDYQDTSQDFWPITNTLNPIGIITFSRGYMDQSWELEYNAYNRTNWYNDFTSPFLQTPNPPDSNEVNFFLRNSNLPMDEIVFAIDNLNIGLNPYIDSNGDPGHYVSEFMAYHGTWYRDINLFGDNNCIAAGHIHVGGYIPIETAILATEESLRTLINYIDSFVYIPGDVNQDTVIDILDLVLVVNHILGDIEFTNIQNYAADMNEDSNINIQDIIIMINLILN